MLVPGLVSLLIQVPELPELVERLNQAWIRGKGFVRRHMEMDHPTAGFVEQ